MTAALLKKPPMEEILKNKQTYTLNMRMQEGREVRVETNDRELIDYFETELKAQMTFMRLVVKQYEIKVNEPKKKSGVPA